MHEIHADELSIGEGAVIEDGVVIRGRHSQKAKRVVIGDNAFIGHDTRAVVDELVIGDYTIVHNNAFIAGDEPCLIGHCCWFGQHVIFNSTGGLTIGNGVGVGAYSQLWSHIKHGDVLQGCRFNSARPLIIDDDVWFVGHCIVSPIHAKSRSMALVGSVVTRDMEENHVYAGVPAKDVTDKVGPQFADVSLEQKHAAMTAKLEEFLAANPDVDASALHVAGDSADPANSVDVDLSATTVFDVATRSYNRRRSPEEFAFMKHLLQDIKFFPRESD